LRRQRAHTRRRADRAVVFGAPAVEAALQSAAAGARRVRRRSPRRGDTRDAPSRGYVLRPRRAALVRRAQRAVAGPAGGTEPEFRFVLRLELRPRRPVRLEGVLRDDPGADRIAAAGTLQPDRDRIADDAEAEAAVHDDHRAARLWRTAPHVRASAAAAHRR